MKKTTLATYGLLGLFGLGLTAQTALAVPEGNVTDTTTGNVDFSVKWPTFPPTGPGPVDPPGPGGNGDDDLNIIYAMDFNFNERTAGTITDGFVNYTSSARSYDGNEVHFPAQPGLFTMAEAQPDPENEGEFLPKEKFYGALGVSIGNSGAIQDWHLYANASQFSTGEVELPGLLMTLKGVTVNQVIGTKAATPTATDIPLTPGINVEVGNYTNVAGEDKERAVNNFVFGSYTPAVVENGEITTPESYTGGVDLFIPAGKDVKNAQYVSNITWTLAQDALED